MVRAVDIEGLMEEYIKEGNLEKCEALYLSSKLGFEEAASTLRMRYGRSGAISSVLDDLKKIGLQEIRWYDRVDDTQETVEHVIREFFRVRCAEMLLERVIERGKILSLEARKLLYIIALLKEEELKSVKPDELRKLYNLMFSEDLTREEFCELLDELIGCYVIDSYRFDRIYFSEHLKEILEIIRDKIPEVEVKIAWKGENS